MKLSSVLIASVSAGYYQGHKHLKGEALDKRTSQCDAKVDEVKETYSIEGQGWWDCQGYGSGYPRVFCYAKCPSGKKPNWPVNSVPELKVMCGDPPSVMKQ